MKAFSFFTFLFLSFAMTQHALAQTVVNPESASPATSQEEPVNLEAKPVEPVSTAVEDVFKEERAQILSRLKNDIEPNLIKADIQRLNRNVMRLGSYRKDWVMASQDFLIANATLAELYVYRYSLLGNHRLNREGLYALNKFQALREPRAILVFMNSFVGDSEQAVLAMQLLTRAVDQSPALAADAIQFLNGPVGNKIALDLKLQFGQKACSKLPSTSLAHKEVLKAWKSKASNFWEVVLSDELDTCLKGV